MSAMIEHIAKALSEAWWPAGEQARWDSLDEAIRRRYRAEAEIALRAMREPTQVMLVAVRALGEDDGYDLAWQIMIDAELAAVSTSRPIDPPRPR